MKTSYTQQPEKFNVNEMPISFVYAISYNILLHAIALNQKIQIKLNPLLHLLHNHNPYKNNIKRAYDVLDLHCRVLIR